MNEQQTNRTVAALLALTWLPMKRHGVAVQDVLDEFRTLAPRVASLARAGDREVLQKHLAALREKEIGAPADGAADRDTAVTLIWILADNSKAGPRPP